MRFNTRYRHRVCKHGQEDQCPNLKNRECIYLKDVEANCNGYFEVELLRICNKEIFVGDKIWIETMRGTHLFVIEKIYSLDGRHFLLPKGEVDAIAVEQIVKIKLM